MLVLYALRLGLDEGQLGIGFAIGAVGGLLGALVTTKVTAWVGEGRVIPLSSLVWMPAGVLMPLAGTVFNPMAAIIGYMLLRSFGVVLYNVAQVSFRQRLCPRQMLGRMNASIRFLVWGVMPIGSFIGGVIGHNFGLRTVFMVEGGRNRLRGSPGADLAPADDARPAARAGPAQRPRRIASSAFVTRAGSSYCTQVMRGSLRNQLS